MSAVFVPFKKQTLFYDIWGMNRPISRTLPNPAALPPRKTDFFGSNTVPPPPFSRKNGTWRRQKQVLAARILFA